MYSFFLLHCIGTIVRSGSARLATHGPALVRTRSKACTVASMAQGLA